MAIAKVIAVTTKDKPDVDEDYYGEYGKGGFDGREVTLELIEFEPVVDGVLMDIGSLIELDVRRA